MRPSPLFFQINCRVTHCGQLGRKRNNEEKRLFFPIFANFTVQIQLESPPLSPTLAFQYEHAICCEKNTFPMSEYAKTLSHRQILMMCVASNHHINTLICLEIPFFPPSKKVGSTPIQPKHLQGPRSEVRDHIYG